RPQSRGLHALCHRGGILEPISVPITLSEIANRADSLAAMRAAMLKRIAQTVSAQSFIEMVSPLLAASDTLTKPSNWRVSDFGWLCLLFLEYETTEVFVLMPGQADHDDIDRRDQQPPHRISKAVVDQLIDDEENEDSNCERIVPELFAQQPDDQPQLKRAVTEQVDRYEELRAEREILRPLDQIIGTKVWRIVVQFVLCKNIHRPEKNFFSDKEGDDPADDLSERKQAL